jgi:hypothetical protein
MGVNYSFAWELAWEWRETCRERFQMNVGRCDWCIPPTSAIWYTPAVDRTKREGALRVDFARSLNHPATPAPCGTAVIRYVALARRKCTRFTGSQTRAHASAETKSSGAIAARRTAFGGRPAFCLGGVFLCGDALCADLTVTQLGIALEAAAAPPRFVCAGAAARVLIVRPSQSALSRF